MCTTDIILYNRHLLIIFLISVIWMLSLCKKFPRWQSSRIWTAGVDSWRWDIVSLCCISLYILHLFFYYTYISIYLRCFYYTESTFFMRCLSGCLPGCRAVKYVQHASKIPNSVVTSEDYHWCTCQCDDHPKGLTEEDRNKDVVATHEKEQTCGGPFVCCNQPYLETKDADGNLIGKTKFVCDWWRKCKCILFWLWLLCTYISHHPILFSAVFVPKFDVFDGNGTKKYRLRPDTCIGGCCVMCRCGGKGSGGKCCRIPYIVRDPHTVSINLPVSISSSLLVIVAHAYHTSYSFLPFFSSNP